ncbi:MAG: GNAT family N-acetyltransferase [Sulfuritalea sp.]|nr:GNAT family N-acetyltransferase [Sulfuritalea sp.]
MSSIELFGVHEDQAMIDIRGCSESDLLPCSALLRQVYAESPYHETWSESSAAEYLEAFFRIDPRGCFVAVEQEAVIGSIFSYSYPWSTGVVLFIQELFVSEPGRRKGVGRGLVARVVDSKGRDSNVALIVREGTAAAELYRKLGLSKSRHFVLYSGKVGA